MTISCNACLNSFQVLVNNSRLKDEFTKDVPKRRKTWRMEEFMTGMKVVTTSVPPYSIWVEGDNAANSQDSQFHGPVSKKLLIGIAEYRVWPPWRVGKLDNSANSLLMEEEKGQDENVDHQNIPLQPKYRSRSYWPWKRA
jgi:Signal peptidase, peptidase S26